MSLIAASTTLGQWRPPSALGQSWGITGDLYAAHMEPIRTLDGIPSGPRRNNKATQIGHG